MDLMRTVERWPTRTRELSQMMKSSASLSSFSITAGVHYLIFNILSFFLNISVHQFINVKDLSRIKALAVHCAFAFIKGS